MGAKAVPIHCTLIISEKPQKQSAQQRRRQQRLLFSLWPLYHSSIFQITILTCLPSTGLSPAAEHQELMEMAPVCVCVCVWWGGEYKERVKEGECGGILCTHV
jgi:hypothetical protein